MNFRSRVLTASMLVAALTVIIASATSYLTTREVVYHSVDVSLVQAYESPTNSQGAFEAVVYANGQSVPTQGFFLDSTILAFARGQRTGSLLRTVFVSNGQVLRELIVAKPAGTSLPCRTDDDGPLSECPQTLSFAEIFSVNFTGQQNELHSLLRTLLLEDCPLLLVTLGLGLLLTRGALRPLEDVTDEIEEIAKDNDVTRRLDEDGDDELGRLRRVFNGLLRSVDEAQALQRQLVMDASHELRTPLTSLRTNAQLMARASELAPDDLLQVTSDMVTQIDELSTLIADLAELARGERSEGEMAEVNLHELVSECVETARTYARLKDVAIEVTDASGGTLVAGRRDRLIRAISNLLTNAIKFSPPSGRITVTVGSGTLVVSDAGPGIDEADIPYIFDRFWRSAKARSLPGSGLGLAIVAQVVAECGGTVAVDRDPVLGGARFTVTLPVLS